MAKLARGTLLVIVLIQLLLTPVQARWNPLGQKHKRSGEENCQLLIRELQKIDPGLKKVFARSHAWAVFPHIGKAGIGVGGASGNGRVYRRGTFIGTTTMTQLSIGLQFGGQVYGEIIFFQDEQTLEKFKDGRFEFGASVSAIVVDAGLAGEAGFKDGTLVVVKPQKGLMYEAAISGQKFTFKGRK